MLPAVILVTWLLGLLSLGMVGATIWCGHEWLARSFHWDAGLEMRVFSPVLGLNEDTMFLLGAVLGCLWSTGGRLVFKAFKKRGNEDPRIPVPPSDSRRLVRPDGSVLHVEFFGPPDGFPVICSHGWGLTSQEWNYLKREIPGHLRLVVWDLPGLGQSSRPRNRDCSMEKLAGDLKAVWEIAGDKPAILLGHSIGGMITLTFCRLFPELLGHGVSGLLLVHTAPVNPVRTSSGAALLTALEKPLLIPIFYLTIALSPFVRIMTWLCYWNGSAHVASRFSAFAGTETWEQLDFATSFFTKASPAILARGLLGMIRYDASRTLSAIPIPALIVGGDRDIITKPEAAEWMKAGIAGSRLEVLAPARHLGLIEHHQEFARHVGEFATSLCGRQSVTEQFTPQPPAF